MVVVRARGKPVSLSWNSNAGRVGDRVGDGERGSTPSGTQADLKRNLKITRAGGGTSNRGTRQGPGSSRRRRAERGKWPKSGIRQTPVAGAPRISRGVDVHGRGPGEEIGRANV